MNNSNMNNKKRKLSSSTNPSMSPIKVEVKEENILGNDYLMAKGRLQGVLKQLTEQSESESGSSDDSSRGYGKRSSESRKKKNETQPTAFHHTYVMKLFDRSVDLARFEEDTPLYPICRAWMANQPRNPQAIIKRRVSTPDPESSPWNNSTFSDVHHLPPPSSPFVSRIPSPLPEQMHQDKQEVNIDYEEKPPVAREVLIRNHIRRWVSVKKKWIHTAMKNEERYGTSKQILQAIYTKAQEGMGAE